MKKIILSFLILLFSLPSFSGKYDSLEIVTRTYGDGSKSYFVNGLPITTKTYSSYRRGEIGAKKLIDIAHNDKESKERQITNTKKPEEEVITDADKAKAKAKLTADFQKRKAENTRKYEEEAPERKRVADAKKAKEKKIADAVKAKAKKKRDDKTKELQRKAAVNKIEKERKAEEKKKQDSIESEKMKRLIAQARKNSQYNPGFRDLKPGMPFEDYKKICPRSNVCYGLQDIKFDASPFYGKIKTVNVLTLDMGPITSDGVFIDLINEFTDPDADIFRKMKNNFDNKYVLDYEFSTRDRQLFNNNEKNKLLVVYSKGQVVLRINRKERKDSRRKDLWLYIEYRDVQQATEFLKTNAPVKATLNDF